MDLDNLGGGLVWGIEGRLYRWSSRIAQSPMKRDPKDIGKLQIDRVQLRQVRVAIKGMFLSFLYPFQKGNDFIYLLCIKNPAGTKDHQSQIGPKGDLGWQLHDDCAANALRTAATSVLCRSISIANRKVCGLFAMLSCLPFLLFSSVEMEFQNPFHFRDRLDIPRGTVIRRYN